VFIRKKVLKYQQKREVQEEYSNDGRTLHVTDLKMPKAGKVDDDDDDDGVCIIKPVAPEPGGSSPNSPEPATSPYPVQGESTPPSLQLPKIHHNPILPSTPRSSKWSLSFWLSHQNPAHFSPLSHACHMPCPPHSP
jgi:hypothetical protein